MFGKVLRDIIEESGLRQGEWAKQYGLSSTAIGLFLNEQNTPSQRTMRHLVAALPPHQQRPALFAWLADLTHQAGGSLLQATVDPSGTAQTWDKGVVAEDDGQYRTAAKKDLRKHPNIQSQNNTPRHIREAATALVEAATAHPQVEDWLCISARIISKSRQQFTPDKK